MQGYETTSAALKLKRNAFDVSCHKKMFCLSKKDVNGISNIKNVQMSLKDPSHRLPGGKA